jgi:hypothetical protein
VHFSAKKEHVLSDIIAIIIVNSSLSLFYQRQDNLTLKGNTWRQRMGYAMRKRAHDAMLTPIDRLDVVAFLFIGSSSLLVTARTSRHSNGSTSLTLNKKPHATCRFRCRCRCRCLCNEIIVYASCQEVPTKDSVQYLVDDATRLLVCNSLPFWARVLPLQRSHGWTLPVGRGTSKVPHAASTPPLPETASLKRTTYVHFFSNPYSLIPKSHFDRIIILRLNNLIQVIQGVNEAGR